MMKHTDKNNVPFKLSREEIERCKQVYETVCSEEDGAAKLLEANFEDGAQMYEEIARGVDEFYTLSAQDVTSDVIRDKLTAAMAGMTPAAQYRYLTNVLVAMSYTGSKLYKNDAWTGFIEDCKTILSAMDQGMMDENDPQIAAKITQLMNLVCSHVESSAVLLVGKPQYENLMNACLAGDPDEVQTLAANTREASIAMAASIYTLYAKDQLPSMNGKNYTPYMMGVMGAYLLDVDALQKSAVWEYIKPRLIRASRAALTLMIGAGIVLAGATLGLLTASIVGLLTESLLLSTIVGAVMGLPVMIAGVKNAKQMSDDLIAAGHKVVTFAAAAVRTAYNHLNDWIHNTVVPTMWPLWQKASAFVRKHVIAPAAVFIGKVRERTVDGYEAAKVKMGAFMNHVYAAAGRVRAEDNDGVSVEGHQEDGNGIQGVEFGDGDGQENTPLVFI